MIAIALTAHSGASGFSIPKLPDGTLDYNNTIPMMLGHYLPSGVLGLGLTALMASFMSGMAGNVTAFNTVWTYDIYQSYIRPGQSDKHYLRMGHMATVFGTHREHGRSLSGGGIQQYHGLSPAHLRVHKRAIVRHVPPRHVLETGDGDTVRSRGCLPEPGWRRSITG